MDKTRKVISMIILITWAMVILLVLGLMAFNIIDLNKGQEVLKSFSSVTSGFVGIIIGYYFSSK